MPFAALKDVSLHYELNGAASAPVLVLSNSVGSGMQLWQPQLDALGRRFRLLRYDTRGHGLSSSPKGEYTIDLLGNDVLQLLDTLAIEQASICGISLGGMTALWLAIHAPSRMQSIVAANTAARIGSVEGWQQRIADVRRQGMTTVAQTSPKRWFTESFLASHPSETSQILQGLAATSPDGYTACCAALRDADLTAGIAGIQTPALIVCGKHDVATPPSDAHLLNRLIQGSQLVELNAAHLSNVEDAAGFNSAAINFFNTIQLP